MIYDYSIFLSFNKKIEMYVDFKKNRELFAPAGKLLGFKGVQYQFSE
jgi:hypothetical protein